MRYPVHCSNLPPSSFFLSLSFILSLFQGQLQGDVQLHGRADCLQTSGAGLCGAHEPVLPVQESRGSPGQLQIRLLPHALG